MRELDVEPVDLGHELRQSVQLRFRRAPIVVAPPVAYELPEHVQLRALGTIGDHLSIGPRVAATRWRRSRSASSGTLTWKGRTAGEAIEGWGRVTWVMAVSLLHLVVHRGPVGYQLRSQPLPPKGAADPGRCHRTCVAHPPAAEHATPRLPTRTWHPLPRLVSMCQQGITPHHDTVTPRVAQPQASGNFLTHRRNDISSSSSSCAAPRGTTRSLSRFRRSSTCGR